MIDKALQFLELSFNLSNILSAINFKLIEDKWFIPFFQLPELQSASTANILKRGILILAIVSLMRSGLLEEFP